MPVGWHSNFNRIFSASKLSSMDVSSLTTTTSHSAGSLLAKDSDASPSTKTSRIVDTRGRPQLVLPGSPT